MNNNNNYSTGYLLHAISPRSTHPVTIIMVTNYRIHVYCGFCRHYSSKNVNTGEFM